MQFKIEKNSVILTPEDEEDLFNLNKVIKKGDIIEGKDIRKVKIGDDFVKKPFFIKLKVEEVKKGNPLRVKGIVLNEHEEFPKGVYHSFTITPFKTIKLTKNFLSTYIFDILKQKKKEPVKAILIDDEKAEFYEIRDTKVDLIKKINYKEKEELNKSNFNYKKIISEINKLGWDNFIIGGPGIFKEKLQEELNKENKKIKFYLANVSHLGKMGIKELMKRKEINTLLKDFKIKEEKELIDRFMEELKKDGKICYGLNKVKEAAEYGAIELLVVDSDKVFNVESNEEEIENILKKVEENKGKVKIIETEEKKRLIGFGGIVAFLRFKI